MWHLLGVLVGVALAMGFAGDRGQHWAVRALCAVGALAGCVGGVVWALFAGRASPVWDAVISGGLAFAVVSVLSALSWLAAVVVIRRAGRER